MVRTVIVGTGNITHMRHIPGVMQAENGTLRGFYDRRVEAAEAIAAQWGVKAYPTYEDVLADPEVDAILIATPTPTHHELAIPALRAGKHVLCEKPMSLNATQSQEMVDEARKAGCKLMICLIQRLYEPCQKARELIEQGAIGRPLFFRTFLGVKGGPANLDVNTPPWKNAVAELGVHRIDLMRYLLHTEVKRVFCALANLDADKPDAAVVSGEDNAMAIVEYENGVYGTMGFSRTSYGGNDRTTQIFGTQGVLTLYGESAPLKLATRDGEVELYEDLACQEQTKREITDVHRLFFDWIERGGTPFTSGEDGLVASKIVDAMIQSNRSGGWVEL